MGRPSNIYILITGSAVGLGILGDGLLRAHPFGLNLTVWTVTVFGAATLLSRLHKPLPSGAYGLVGVGVLFSSTFLWRDSLTLKWLSGFAVFTLFALSMQWPKGLRLRLTGVMRYKLAVAEGLVLAIQGAIQLVARDFVQSVVDLNQSGSKNITRWALALARGFLIAVPLVLIFGALFLSADVAYRTIVSDFFDLRELVKHLAVTVLCAWLAASALKGLLDGSATQISVPADIANTKLGEIEAGVVMTMLNALFLSFVVVQFRYLFGGEERIRAIADLTYAEYARAGFFELCAASALVLGVLLLGDWLLRDAAARGKRIFRILAGFQVLMVVVIMDSAFLRMWLYLDAYGLTELRLYSTAFMIWLAVVFVWFTLTVLLRSRREQFAFGAFVAGLAAIFLLHAVNPDAAIVKVNTARAQKGKQFDARYAASLSADAVPELVALLPKLKETERSTIARKLQLQWLQGDPPDRRTWSWGRSRAARAVMEQKELIEKSAGRSERGPAYTL